MAETMEKETGQRWHDLDAVRALALLLGVALHATMSFIEPQMWIVKDVSHDPGLGVLFYVIHMFRMITFFVLAGFFARMLMQKRGVGGFVANRLKRVALPLVVFWPLIFASIVTIVILANMPAPGSVATSAPPPPPPGLTAQTFPLTHLWFLYMLLILYAGAVVLKLVTDLLHIGGVLGKMLDGAMGLLVRTDMISAVLIIPMAAALWSNPQWIMWFGVMTPDTGLVPNVMALASYITAFGFGWLLHRRSDLLVHLAKRWWLYLVSAAVATWWCLAIVGTQPAFIPVNGHDHPIYILVYALGAWSWTLGLIGITHAFLRAENPLIRYLSDASYWVYIIHIPVLMTLQYLIKDVAWPADAKYAVILMGTVTIALLTYQIVVRYSFIGAILNGRRRKSKASSQEVLA